MVLGLAPPIFHLMAWRLVQRVGEGKNCPGLGATTQAMVPSRDMDHKSPKQLDTPTSHPPVDHLNHDSPCVLFDLITYSPAEYYFIGTVIWSCLLQVSIVQIAEDLLNTQFGRLTQRSGQDTPVLYQRLAVTVKQVTIFVFILQFTMKKESRVCL